MLPQISKKKILIFGQGRSGSTLLKQLIDSHPEIICEGELLNPKDGYITNYFFRKLIYKFPCLYFNLRAHYTTTSIYGFTLLYYQYGLRTEILTKLIKSGWKIIYIYRNNSIEQVFSHLVASKTNLWHRTKTENELQPKTFVSKEEFLHRVEMLTKHKKDEIFLMNKFPHLKIVYEDDLKDKLNWQKTANRIFEYIETTPESVKASLEKTYTKPYSEIIQNYDELMKSLKNSKLSFLIDNKTS